MYKRARFYKGVVVVSRRRKEEFLLTAREISDTTEVPWTFPGNGEIGH